MSLAKPSGLILSARVGKHTDQFIEELVISTEGKTACREWDTDGWGGYHRVFTPEVDHYIGKTLTQGGGAHQWYCAATNWSLASAAEQVWQSVGADRDYSTISAHLFQLALAAFGVQNNSGAASRINSSSVELG